MKSSATSSSDPGYNKRETKEKRQGQGQGQRENEKEGNHAVKPSQQGNISKVAAEIQLESFDPARKENDHHRLGGRKHDDCLRAAKGDLATPRYLTLTI